jgi:hypothetical protein
MNLYGFGRRRDNALRYDFGLSTRKGLKFPGLVLRNTYRSPSLSKTTKPSSEGRGKGGQVVQFTLDAVQGLVRLLEWPASCGWSSPARSTT